VITTAAVAGSAVTPSGRFTSMFCPGRRRRRLAGRAVSIALVSAISLCAAPVSSASQEQLASPRTPLQWGNALAAAGPAAPGSSAPGSPPIRNVDLSDNGRRLAASVPKIALDPRDPAHIAVIWRFVPTASPGARHKASSDWVCHLSLSMDGGEHFSDRIIDWQRPRTPRCNAPYVFYASDGDLYMGATLVGADIGAHDRAPPFGRAVVRKSVDGGRTWSATVSVIATDSQRRFAPNPAIPAAARLIPWDGASGVVDRKTGAIFVSSGYPAPPGGAAHSQRFYARSTDGGRTWGPIRAFGSAAWPERWDGHMAAAHGEFAVSYIAGEVPVPHAPCPCVVFGTSRDGGRTLRRHYLVSVSNIDTLVHYPPIAANPVRHGVFSLALVPDDARQVYVWVSVDNGRHWAKTRLQEPADVVKTSRPALAYAPNGTLVAMWRGYHADGSFDVYVAGAPDGRHFHRAVRLSSVPSRIPEALLSNYAVRGDFINSVAANARLVCAAWTDWRTGTEARVYYGSVPMGSLLAARP
jgi:hypothetical protein